MAWVKLDDRFFENPKVLALSGPARLAHLEAICYCARELTDGFIPSAKAKVVAGKARVLQELVPSFWEPCEGGYKVHDYLLYNPTREQVLAERDKAKARMQGVRSANVRPNIARTKGGSSASPVPLPDPDPEITRDSDLLEPPPPDGVGVVISEWAHFGLTNDRTVQYIEEAVETYGLDNVRRAVKAAGIGSAGGDKPPWAYCEKILARWKQQGGPDDVRLSANSQHRNAPRGRPGGVITEDELDRLERYARGEIEFADV